MPAGFARSASPHSPPPAGVDPRRLLASSADASSSRGPLATLRRALHVQSRRDRVAAKFVENEFEKCDRLMELYLRYEGRVAAEEARWVGRGEASLGGHGARRPCAGRPCCQAGDS